MLSGAGGGCTGEAILPVRRGGSFGGVALLVGPAVGHGAVESFDSSVGLRAMDRTVGQEDCRLQGGDSCATRRPQVGGESEVPGWTSSRSDLLSRSSWCGCKSPSVAPFAKRTTIRTRCTPVLALAGQVPLRSITIEICGRPGFA